MPLKLGMQRQTAARVPAAAQPARDNKQNAAAAAAAAVHLL